MLALLLASMSLAATVVATTTAVPWSAITGGGGRSSSAGHTIETSIAQGQPVGVSSSTNYALGAGFLGGAVAAPPAVPASFLLGPSVQGSAGGSVFSTNFRLGGTLGQGQPVGVSSSQSFGVQAGFWTGTRAPTPNKWDLNGDDRVDGADLRVVAANLGAAGGIADLNCDGRVDILDLAEVALHISAPSA